jgi:hypothetical protein
MGQQGWETAPGLANGRPQMGAARSSCVALRPRSGRGRKAAVDLHTLPEGGWGLGRGSAHQPRRCALTSASGGQCCERVARRLSHPNRTSDAGDWRMGRGCQIQTVRYERRAPVSRSAPTGRASATPFHVNVAAVWLSQGRGAALGRWGRAVLGASVQAPRRSLKVRQYRSFARQLGPGCGMPRCRRLSAPGNAAAVYA